MSLQSGSVNDAGVRWNALPSLLAEQDRQGVKEAVDPRDVADLAARHEACGPLVTDTKADPGALAELRAAGVEVEVV